MKRSPALVLFAPVLLYVLVLFALAAADLHPPLLGWIGLVALGAAWLAATTLLGYGLPRMGSNTVYRHPRLAGRYRLLVVVDGRIDADELRDAVRLRLVGRGGDVRFVAPVRATPLHFLAGDEGHEQRTAERHLDAALSALGAAGIDASGSVGTDDMLQAIGDALVGYAAEEILFVGAVGSRRSWFDRDFERRARETFGLPVSAVLVGARAAA